MASHTHLPEPVTPAWLPVLGLALFVTFAVGWMLTPPFPSTTAAAVATTVDSAAATGSAAAKMPQKLNEADLRLKGKH
jgi:hypothetical protein